MKKQVVLVRRRVDFSADRSRTRRPDGHDGNAAANARPVGHHALDLYERQYPQGLDIGVDCGGHLQVGETLTKVGST